MANLSTISAQYWHALNLIIPQNLWKLKDVAEILGGSQAIWEANLSALKEGGLNPKLAERIAEGRIRLNIEEEWERLISDGIQAIDLKSGGYPENLAQIHSAPPIIYVRGRIELLGQKGLAVVGSRKLSSYGQDAVDALIPPLASLGINIVSGMALGADSAALESCLENGGVPIAVVASSLVWDEISPRANLDLARRIMEAGCLVSENPPGAMINKGHFPLRNRIISGLAEGVLVIEAAERSGSAVTARLALEQNREIFAVPGSIFSFNSQGTLDLIKQGAKCVTTASDIAREFGWDIAAARKIKIESADPLHKSIHDLLAQGPATADEIVRKINCLPQEIMAGLTELEVTGNLRRSGNGVYHNVT